MNKPYKFKTKEDLIRKLREKKSKIKDKYLRNKKDAEEIIEKSAGPNTFRAFSHMRCKPSKVYKEWASNILKSKNKIREINGISSQKQYDKWLKKFSEDFAQYWKKKQRKKIRYGPGRKLINLFMKDFVLWDKIKDSQRKRLINFLHVPLDSYVLKAIRNLIPEYNIPANATMSFIKDEKMYNKIQNFLREIAKSAGVPPIYLDALFWNERH